MSSPIYVVSMSFFVHFFEYALLFLDITWLRKLNNFQKAKVLHSFCLIFYQFQLGVVYKSVAYKKVYAIRHL